MEHKMVRNEHKNFWSCASSSVFVLQNVFEMIFVLLHSISCLKVRETQSSSEVCHHDYHHDYPKSTTMGGLCCPSVSSYFNGAKDFYAVELASHSSYHWFTVDFCFF